MSVNPDVAGRSYPPAPPFQVGREAVRAFASAVQAQHPAHHDVEAARALGHADLLAPPTFAVVIAQRAEAAAVDDPEVGIDFSRVVHGEESLTLHRPVVAGDRLVPTLTVESVRAAGGHAMVTTRVDLADEDGAEVAAVRSMLVVRGE